MQERVNDFFDVLTLIGELSLFLFGMNLMGDALKSVRAGTEKPLGQTHRRRRGFLTGGVTAITSSATKFDWWWLSIQVCALRQAIYVKWCQCGHYGDSGILSLSGIESSIPLLFSNRPHFTPILALIVLRFI